MKRIILMLFTIFLLFSTVQARVVSPQDCINNEGACLLYDDGSDKTKIRESIGSATLTNGVFNADANNDAIIYDWTDSDGGTSGVVTIELDARWEDCSVFRSSMYSNDDADSNVNTHVWMRPGNTANKWSFRTLSGSYSNVGTCNSAQWYTLRFEQNLTSDTFDFYVDDVLTGNDIVARSNQAELDRFGFYLGTADYLEWANVTVYEGLDIVRTLDKKIFYNVTNNDYLNYTPNIFLNTTQNVDMSYIQNAGVETSICSTCNQTTFTPTLVEGLNEFIFLSNGGELNTSLNLTYDTTNPTITNNLGSEVNSYTVNLNLTLCNDTNIDTCIFTIQGANTNKAVTTAAGTTFNGNWSYNITATDLAGNQFKESGILFINPYQYFYFEDSLSNPITSFSFGGTAFTDFAQFKTYDLGLGFSNLEFIKSGYVTQNFNVTLTNTSAINQTLTGSIARIVLTIKDKTTSQQIAGELFFADFIATVGARENTTTGQIILSNTFFLDESYTVTVSSENYSSETVFFDFTNDKELLVDAYVSEKTDTNIGTVSIKVVDLASKPVKNARVFAEQWDSSSSSFLAVSQDLTGEDGLGNVRVILNDKTYKFSATSNGATGESVNDIITDSENGKTITIVLDSVVAARNYFLQNLEYTVTESFNNATNVSTLTVDWTNTDGLSQEICINRYRTLSNSEKLQNSNCATGVSGELIQGYFINSSLLVTLKAEVKYNGNYITLEEFRYDPQSSASQLLLDLNLAPFVIPLLFLISIAIGLYIENLYIGTFLLSISSGLSLLLVPTLTNGGITTFFFFMGWLAISSGVKPR